MARTKDEMVAEAREAAPQLTVQEAKARVEAGATVIDVREPNEFIVGRVPGAENIPRGTLEFKLDHPALLDPSKEILVYCKAGGRGALAAKTLVELGFTNVSNIATGFAGWFDEGFDTEANPEVC